jgi:very-short-patch-repair endonuclease
MKDIDLAVTALAKAQDLVFSRAQATGAGASRSTADRRLRSGTWVRTPVPSVYALAGWAPTWRSLLVAATLKGAVVSHRSAAVLWCIWEGTNLEVTVPPGTNHRLGSRIRVHRSHLGRLDRARTAGLPVTSVERTLVDLAAFVAEAAVEDALEASLRRGLTTVERVRERLAVAQPGRPGVQRLRSVLHQRGGGRAAGSDLETKVLRLLRAAALPPPVRQHEVRVGDQRYFLDLAWPDRRLAIELDGYESHRGRRAFSDDRARQNALVLAGWSLLRYSGDQARHDPQRLVAHVVTAMAA